MKPSTSSTVRYLNCSRRKSRSNGANDGCCWDCPFACCLLELRFIDLEGSVQEEEATIGELDGTVATAVGSKSRSVTPKGFAVTLGAFGGWWLSVVKLEFERSRMWGTWLWKGKEEEGRELVKKSQSRMVFILLSIGLAIQLQLRVPKRQAAYLKHVSRLISGRIKRRKSFFSDEVDAPESVTFPVASFSWSASRCLCRIFRKKRLPLLFVIELPLV